MISHIAGLTFQGGGVKREKICNFGQFIQKPRRKNFRVAWLWQNRKQPKKINRINVENKTNFKKFVQKWICFFSIPQLYFELEILATLTRLKKFFNKINEKKNIIILQVCFKLEKFENHQKINLLRYNSRKRKRVSIIRRKIFLRLN